VPLAHGIIHSLRLIADREQIFPRMAKIFCRAISVSVAVVADLRAGEGVEEMEQIVPLILT
jgi:hypothetical protein